ncbi:efflux RND transporter periplasmic adaptor subunit [Saliniramus sp.]|uniref:efflux RND transporter periplasmic adaptor subunit n=1 Tax=Saliniramus sp. TaxID=2986772 RepID=UPI002C656E3C|nr:HlyD family efflux transporter periplasmic adaptor subunit [Saliniramus sp.]HMB11311.1 HlyD family efflux transporter periplasmic adaptor subunit [Saliniramus sp.]
MSDQPPRKGLTLATLLELEKRARAAEDAQALGFLMVNDTHLAIPYRQAAWFCAASNRLRSLSGLATPDRDAPFTRRLETFFRKSLRPQTRTQSLTATRMGEAFGPEGSAACSEARAFFTAHLPAQIALLPLRYKDVLHGALMFAREEPFTRGEINALDHLADAYGHALAALTGPRRRQRRLRRSRVIMLAGLVTLAALMALPVRQSVLAPAEIVAQQPDLVRAPLAGVIETVHVRPNAAVSAGTKLVSLDGSELDTQRQIARQQLSVAEAELRQARQQALFDPQSRARLAVLEGRRDQHAAELTFLNERLARIDVTAVRDGIAIFDDVDDWEGRPVALGERIMLLADPQARALEINLAVADAINLEPGADIRFFLNIDPADPIAASLTRAGYRARAMPDGTMAYRLRAALDDDDPRLRIGLRGTARIYGEHTLLVLYLLRRPIAWLRLQAGL